MAFVPILPGLGPPTLCFTQGWVTGISDSLLSDVLDLETDDDICFKKSHIAYV